MLFLEVHIRKTKYFSMDKEPDISGFTPLVKKKKKRLLLKKYEIDFIIYL